MNIRQTIDLLDTIKSENKFGIKGITNLKSYLQTRKITKGKHLTIQTDGF